MDNVFAREQLIYDEAVAILLSADDVSQFDLSNYGKLVDEYGKLLKQVRHYRGHPEFRVQYHSKGAENEMPEFLSKVHFDVLTGIFNRRYLHENLDRVLSTMSRVNDILSVMIIDIDYFSLYNETYGHNAGDDCLRYVAEALKSCLFRGHDFVARYGGEEFMAILPHTHESGARMVADRMLDEVKKLQIPHSTSLVTGIITVSIGVVTGSRNPNGWQTSDFFSRVDEALLHAKGRGRNQYAYLSL